MKWRCPQCGKPHERNDPPCENCGHHKLQRAVVPHASEEEDREQFVWACSECGRHHQRNNPPCSRCGNATFEKKSLEYDEFDPGDTKGYRELVGRTEVGLAVAVVLLIVAGVLGYLGVVNVPGITPQGPPTVEDVPGGDDRAGSLALSDVETEMLAEINERRSARPIQRNDALDRMSTYVVRLTAKRILTGEQRDIEQVREELNRFDIPCDNDPVITGSRSGSVTGSDVVAGTVARQLFDSMNLDDGSPTEGRFSNIGIGTHAGPNGTVFATAVYC